MPGLSHRHPDRVQPVSRRHAADRCDPGHAAQVPLDGGPRRDCRQVRLLSERVAAVAAGGRALGLLPQGENRWCRHPLAWLVEAADDICYALLDLEDGLEMGILRFEEVAEVLIQIAGGEPPDYATMQSEGVSQRRRIAALRGAAMEQAVNEVAKVFVQHEANCSTARCGMTCWSSAIRTWTGASSRPRIWRASASFATSARPSWRSAPTPRWVSCSRPSSVPPTSFTTLVIPTSSTSGCWR